MKKIISILIITVMAMATLVPLASANNSLAIDWEPNEGGATPQEACATGRVEYTINGGGTTGGGSGNSEPLKILALWQEVGGWDDDMTKKGLQVDPPMAFCQTVTVCAYAVIEDPSDVLDTSMVKFDISWPMFNPYPGLQQYDGHYNEVPGDLKYDNLHPDFASYSDYLDAYNNLHVSPNTPFICYKNGANDGGDKDFHDYVDWQWSESNIKVVYRCFDLYYCDPAGWYDVEVSIYGPINTDTQINYFEYVMGIGAEIDFDTVDFGQKTDHLIWHEYDGNWEFDTTEQPDRPTIRNIGNWDAELGVHFAAGSFDPAYVRHDVRVGASNPAHRAFNFSYAEAHGGRDVTQGIGAGMMNPDTDYYPLPIDNTHEQIDGYRDDTLLKCHTVKMDFYLYPGQWNLGEAIYEYDITIFVDEPSYGIYENPGYPCEHQI